MLNSVKNRPDRSGNLFTVDYILRLVLTCLMLSCFLLVW